MTASKKHHVRVRMTWCSVRFEGAPRIESHSLSGCLVRLCPPPRNKPRSLSSRSVSFAILPGPNQTLTSSGPKLPCMLSSELF